jgi:hypothetical protein
VHIDAVDTDDEKIAYYGQMEDIWELNYSDFKVPVLRCHWVQSAKGVMKDPYGFTTIDLENLDTRKSHLYLWFKLPSLLCARHEEQETACGAPGEKTGSGCRKCRG